MLNPLKAARSFHLLLHNVIPGVKNCFTQVIITCNSYINVKHLCLCLLGFSGSGADVKRKIK